MTIKYFPELEQGSDEWFAARCGILTASEMKHVLTPALKVANNDKTRQHVWELCAQRITGYVEPSYVSDDMLRGWEDEIEARIQYGEHYAAVEEIGFVTNDVLGFPLGYSPDGVVGNDGLIEVKSRRQKYQVQTIVEHMRGDVHVPEEYVLQLQTGLFVTDRKWCDFISYSAGLPMVTIRVERNDEVIDKIVAAAIDFESRIKVARDDWDAGTKPGSQLRLIPTERKDDEEIVA